jgi:VanZ family protein
VRSPLLAWLSAAAWAALIYVLSDVPHLHAATGTLDLILRKCAHVAEYAVLALLLRRALSLSGVRHAAGAAIVIAVAYAASDELHQSFVRGRNGTPRDVAIDLAGVVAGALLVPRLPRRGLQAA